MKGFVVEILQLINSSYRMTIDVETNEDLNNIVTYKNNKVLCDFEIKKHREKRSLSANAYCWVLIEKLAEKMKKSKDEVYREMLRDYGTIATDSDGKKVIFSVKKEIDVSKYFKYYKELGLSRDEKYMHYFVVKGSSEYDTKEMTRFIEGIVEECKQLNIETLTPEEIQKLEM